MARVNLVIVPATLALRALSELPEGVRGVRRVQ